MQQQQSWSKTPGNRLCVGGDAIELLDDNEILVALEDAGDAEAAEEDDAGDEGAAQSKCGEGSKREGCDDGNDLGKKMDHHKTEMLKWKNGVGERIEQKLADTYKKIGCIAAIECYSLMLGEYSVELTNSRRLWTGLVVGEDELDEDYNQCILPSNNGRHPGRTPSKRRES
ncbi:hypothetical protein Cgig2_021919 [Carnegiea gigantea]|uniref:Uncharacterized protein n=1 Tax=Carnegiea gigantea TaxID=171969 RepID=A0A9Q1GTZ3_9CARY|nr:hypothetical protein Cgig2_021919 [Carnegiea gigantea]